MSARKIIVTGFGPFGEHEVNASWECVKLLPSEIDGFEIIKEQVPVSYDTVDEKIKALWQQHQPEFVIHVGVSSFTNKITLETCAHKEGYIRKDIHGKLPKNNECSVECSEVHIPVGLDVKMICDHLNSQKENSARLSDIAGRYLCEYILFTSLSINKNKAIFIHVPPLGKPFSEEELADAIVQIIKCILQQNKSC